MLKSLSTYLTGLAIILISGAFILQPPDEGLAKILSKFQQYLTSLPQEKLYLHVDKDTYVAGEDIWFSAYLLDAMNHRKDSISRTIYVELFNQAKTLLQRRVIYSSDGLSHGDFHLFDTLTQGSYSIRAYTNYMKNVGEDFFFEKEISVINFDKKHKSKNSSVSSTDLQFFPEGGDMLTDVENQIAFKAADQNGRGIFVEGDVVDETGTVVTSFKSEHNGMGMLRFIPSLNHKYVARTKNSGRTVALPAALQKGYILRILDMGADIKITAYSNLKKFSPDPCIIYLVAQTRGTACYAARGEIINTALITKIPKSKLPTGITQITLFNGEGVPQCERLIFINHQDALTVSVKPDLRTYTKKKAVTIDIAVKRKGGTAAKGFFSLAVVDDARISTEAPRTIVTNLLLTSDLKGYIEDPGYYLKDTIQQTKHHLDLLMMTHGWRRFTWKAMLQENTDPPKYYNENGIVISGKVLKALSKKPSINSDVKIFTQQKDFLILKTDSLGRFYTDELFLNDSSQLMIQTDNAKGKQSDLQLTLDPFNVSPPLNYKTMTTEAERSDSLSYFITTRNNPLTAQGKTTVLKEVEVKATRIKEESNFKLYGIPDETINMKDIPQGYTNILQAIQGRVAGVMVSGNSVSIRGGGTPLFLLNGMQVDQDVITSTLNVNDVESIDILKGASAAIYGGRGGNGVIAINTKKGYVYHAPSVGIHTMKYPGYYKAKEFYSPNYDVASEPRDTLDVRNTLYWNPSIKTDSNGKAQIRFFTSNVSSAYKIIVEGISEDGIPGNNSCDLTVE